MDRAEDRGSRQMMQTALYRHFRSDGSLLYVGISVRPLARLCEHQDSAWFSEIARVEVTQYPSREMAIEAERQAIISEKPRYNIIHNGSRKKAQRNKPCGPVVGLAEVRLLCGINPVYSKSFPRPINPDDVGKWKWLSAEVDQWIARRKQGSKGSWKPPIEQGDQWMTSSDIEEMADHRIAWHTFPQESARAVNYGRGPFVMKGRRLWRLSDISGHMTRYIRPRQNQMRSESTTTCTA